MWRRAFQLTAASSFVLCLAVHLVWLRSHFCTESVTWENRGGWRSVRTAPGYVQVGMFLSDWSGQPASQFHGPKYQREEVRPQCRPPFNSLALLCSSEGETEIDWERAGFALAAKLDWNHGDYHLNAVAPCWFLGALTLLLPAVATRMRLRRGR